MWLSPPRLPLGDPCRGHCTTGLDTAAQPCLDEIRKLCNLGYARGRCPRFPAAYDGADAIRFSITRHEGDAVGLVCIFEKDYSPGRYSAMIYDTRAARFTTPMESPCLEAQARKFVDSYLNRKLKS
jgi:hypothetical protein